MREVAIVGAGELGGLAAHALARHDAAARVRLIDDAGRIAEGKALDISQASPVEGFASIVTGSTDLSTAAGAGLIVVADHAGGTEWTGDEALRLIRRLHALAPRALLLGAGASHRELIERSVRELHIPRGQIFGSACEALRAAATAIVALELDVSPDDVALSILGVPPGHLVIAWDDGSVAGSKLTTRISEPLKRQLARRIEALWPAGPYALASAACKVVQAVAGRSRRRLTCFVAPDDQDGVRSRAAAVPVRLGPQGIVEVMMPELSGVERVALDNAVML